MTFSGFEVPRRSLMVASLTIVVLGLTHQFLNRESDRVTGRVTFDNARLRDATVILAGISDGPQANNYFTTTDESGRFVFPKEIAEGEYRVLIRGRATNSAATQNEIDHVQREIRDLAKTTDFQATSGRHARRSEESLPAIYSGLESSPFNLTIPSETQGQIELHLFSERIASAEMSLVRE